MLSAIENRRSIRRYKSTPVPKQMTEEIIRSGCLAPSSKNRQPWRFIVAEGDAKRELLDVMRRGQEREKQQPLLPNSANFIKGAEYTISIMEQAPTVILVINPLGIDVRKPVTSEDRIYEICNAQSIGACMENMTLTATDLGFGSLWICDTYFAYDELKTWAGGEITAAMVVGYADESPSKRPRRNFDDIVEWRG